MENKFEIKCLECNSSNVVILEDIDYDSDDIAFSWGYYLECKDCGNNDL